MFFLCVGEWTPHSSGAPCRRGRSNVPLATSVWTQIAMEFLDLGSALVLHPVWVLLCACGRFQSGERTLQFLDVSVASENGKDGKITNLIREIHVNTITQTLSQSDPFRAASRWSTKEWASGSLLWRSSGSSQRGEVLQEVEQPTNGKELK